jgi:uncharacterized surface protein with fasciclin (FAS1) repeats
MKKTSIIRVSLLAITALALITVSCNDDEPDTQPTPTITDLIVNDPNFSILESAVVKANLSNALATGNPLTVFAPDNAAFTAAGITEAFIASLPVSRVDSILKYHVHPGFVTASDVPASNTITTLLGTQLYASNNANGVFFNGIGVKQANVQASNGVVHVINGVLIPPTRTIAQIAVADTSFSFLVQAVTRAGLLSAISGPGKFTVFAPNNAAFRAAGITDIGALPQATVETVVKYHIIATNVFASDLINNATAPTLQGGNLLINTSPARVKIATSTAVSSNITAANITATNGVVHVVDRVLLP